MSDSNRVALRYVKESTIGVTPANPAFKDLRYTSSSLAYNPQTVTSNELRSDRQVTDLILVGAEVSGSTETELSFEALDDMFEGGMFSTWTAQTNLAITDVDDALDTITVASGGAAFTAGSLAKISGCENSENNICFTVSSSTATTIVGTGLSLVDEVPSDATIRKVGVEGASGDLVAVTDGITSTTLDFTTLGLVVGQWVKIGGAATGTKYAAAANNGYARIGAISAAKLTFSVLPPDWTADAGTGKTIRLFFSEYIREGVTDTAFTLEQAYEGLTTPEYEYFPGTKVATIGLQIDTQSILTASIGFMGTTATIGTTRLSGATTVEAPTNDVMNTSSNVGTLRQAGAAVEGPNFVMGASLNLDNSLRMKNAVGHIGAVGIGVGRFVLTGNLNTYFGSSEMVQKVRNNTASSFDMVVTDPLGDKSYVFDVPKIKFSSGSPTNQGIDTDVMVDLGFQGIRHPTLGFTFQIARFHYVE